MWAWVVVCFYRIVLHPTIAKGAPNMVRLDDGTFKIVVDMSEYVGDDQADHATKWMTVIINKSQNNKPRINNSFPVI